jgi:hypothetical protein
MIIQTAVTTSREILFRNCTFDSVAISLSPTIGTIQPTIGFSGCIFKQFCQVDLTNCNLQLENTDFRGVPVMNMADSSFFTSILVPNPPGAPVLRQFVTPVSNCLFCGVSISNTVISTAPPSFDNCTFQYRVFGLANIGPAVTSYFTNCKFLDFQPGQNTLAFGNSLHLGGNYNLQNCYIKNCSIFVDSDITVVTTFKATNCTFDNVEFTGTIRPNIYQFLYCDIRLRSAWTFTRTTATDIHMLKYCNIIAVASMAPDAAMIIINNDNLITSYCTFNSSGTPLVNATPVFDLNFVTTLLLYSANLECINANYVTSSISGSGTVIRPSTNDSTNTNRGTNLILGPGGVGAGITVTNSNPWVSGSFRLV